MILVNEDIRPWMLEPATEKQIKFAEAIGRVVGFHLHKNPTKLDASVFITEHSTTYYARIAKHINDADRNGNPYNVQVAPSPLPSSHSNYKYEDRDKIIREEEFKSRMRTANYEAEKRALASMGIGIGPWGERYDLNEED